MRMLSSTRLLIPRLIIFIVELLVLTVRFVDAAPLGTWNLLVENAGISSMHTAVTHYDTVILLDRTNIGASRINFTNGYCRDNPDDRVLKHDCSAHSVMFDPLTNSLRPLTVFTDTWCSSGQIVANGSMVQTGGDYEGLYKVRLLDACPAGGSCDWVESESEALVDPRWYASNQVLPDGRQIVVGGRYTYSYEFVPKTSSGEGSFSLSFLHDVQDNQNDNMYPFVHLLPDGNLFIFANRDSILLDYVNNRVLKTYPTIPGEPRNYPSAGSSVMLPLDHTNNFTVAEILVCGGAQYGAFRSSTGNTWPASDTCGRIVATDSNPKWSMETMPIRRTMGDTVILPTADILLINGARNGCQGWGKATNPALNPVNYATYNAASRFQVLAPTTIPRLYHSTANLLTDGRILLAGSNTHQYYTFSGDYPTELRIDAFAPPYLDSSYDTHRPAIFRLSTTSIRYGSMFQVVYTVGEKEGEFEVNLLSSPFTTHSYSQGQRMLRLATTEPVPTILGRAFSAMATAPGSAVVAPPGYYMLLALQGGIPSKGLWVRLTS
ncbi:hypothetical protein KC19_3G078000 [Ceratodon purpureus]|uniref:Galactose oxidase n=1 Tax=Ceratodon purpureus TaxID=3225 RepID=A0A8T0IJH5_CERPU|nr:hypothetical protein KC19_3G078000 [Ceratodon purpureus]KAG0582698.1 hypothetical protein KC19_3G078000 [Ceratodon purpureus]